MTYVDEHGRVDPPTDGDEAATLLGFLDYQRATFVWKTDGLDAAGLAATTAASTMTLGGLLKHLAMVEDYWFQQRLHHRPSAMPWDESVFADDRDWEFSSAADDAPDDLRALWRDSVERSRALVAEAMADGGLSRPCAWPWDDGRAPSLRWVLCHLVEEYARHNGHADLLREAVDGSTGE